ncbi:MAG: putative zinc-binding protein [Candidatus Cloacimonetes bacterium]|nr:putative zinc-binding protein [Candidatus Cloacimonadota bacterium]
MSEKKCSCGCSDNSSGCATSASSRSVYACAGASNVGKISYELAIELHNRGEYGISCAVGVGADLCGFVEGASKSNHTNLLIDGCPVGCLKQMFDNKGIDNYDHIIVTEMGIAKEGNFDYDPAVIAELTTQIHNMGL